jgi:hypothetical protein
VKSRHEKLDNESYESVTKFNILLVLKIWTLSNFVDVIIKIHYLSIDGLAFGSL